MQRTKSGKTEQQFGRYRMGLHGGSEGGEGAHGTGVGRLRCQGLDGCKEEGQTNGGRAGEKGAVIGSGGRSAAPCSAARGGASMPCCSRQQGSPTCKGGLPLVPAALPSRGDLLPGSPPPQALLPRPSPAAK